MPNPPELDALRAAVRLARRPVLATAMRHAPVPKGVILLFQVLSRLEEPTALAVRQLRRDPTSIRAIAGHYVEQVLSAGDPDAYRVLGLPRDASQEQILTHLEAAEAWLLPYVGTFRWEDEFASAVAAAGQAIGTEDDRIAYDQAEGRDRVATAPGHPPRGRVRRRSFVFALVAIAWFGLLSVNFLANEPLHTANVAYPSATSAASEVNPAVDVVRVKVVKGPESPSISTDAAVAALKRPEAAATLSQPHFDGAFPTPDFETAFEEQGVSPPGEVGLTTAVASENRSAPPTMDDRSPSTEGDTPPSVEVVVATVTASEPLPDPAVTANLIANATEASAVSAVATAAQLKPAPPVAAAAVEPVNLVATPPEPEPVVSPVAPAPMIVASPSFNCSRASTDTELAICADPTLATKDRELADTFRQVRRSLAAPMRASAKSLQQDWLKVRDSCGESKSCILGAYQSRIHELSAQLQ